MSAVNYGTSDYITIGLKPYDYDNYKFYSDTDGDYRTDFDALNADYEMDYDNIKSILDKYDFSYFHVVLKNGYYEGFYIDIENNHGICYDSYDEKREALKELTQIKRFLIECVNNGLCQVFPGWCTSYNSRIDSIKGIKAAIKSAKEEIQHTPTWYYCQRMGIEI